jgi:hypothetical protein
MGTKPTTKTELVEFISDKARLSALTVPALNTIWGILHSSKRPKKAGSSSTRVEPALHNPPPLPNVDAAKPARARGARVRFIGDEIGY